MDVSSIERGRAAIAGPPATAETGEAFFDALIAAPADEPFVPAGDPVTLEIAPADEAAPDDGVLIDLIAQLQQLTPTVQPPRAAPAAATQAPAAEIEPSAGSPLPDRQVLAGPAPIAAPPASAVPIAASVPPLADAPEADTADDEGGGQGEAGDRPSLSGIDAPAVDARLAPAPVAIAATDAAPLPAPRSPGGIERRPVLPRLDPAVIDVPLAGAASVVPGARGAGAPPRLGAAAARAEAGLAQATRTTAASPFSVEDAPVRAPGVDGLGRAPATTAVAPRSADPAEPHVAALPLADLAEPSALPIQLAALAEPKAGATLESRATATGPAASVPAAPPPPPAGAVPTIPAPAAAPVGVPSHGGAAGIAAGDPAPVVVSGGIAPAMTPPLVARDAAPVIAPALAPAAGDPEATMTLQDAAPARADPVIARPDDAASIAPAPAAAAAAPVTALPMIGPATFADIADDPAADAAAPEIAAPAPVPVAPLMTTPIASRQIAEAVAAPAAPAIDTARTDWMASMIEQVTELREAGSRSMLIRLLPDALGAVDVRIDRRDDGATQVSLAADNPQARTMLAEAAPRLVEMAEARGLRFEQANIGAGNGGSRQPAADPQRQQAAAPAPAAESEADNDAAPAAEARRERIA